MAIANSSAIREACGATIVALMTRLLLSVMILTKPCARRSVLLAGISLSGTRAFLYLRFFLMRSSSVGPMAATSG